jgi:choline-sulfatase
MKKEVILSTALFSLTIGINAKQKNEQPNILLLISDEHNANIMGCDGNPLARTPTLDGLAKSGIYFNSFYCSSPQSVPSRQSLTTGKYVSHHNVWGNTPGVPEGTPSLARLLNAVGYESYLSGKMHYMGVGNHGFIVLDDQEKKKKDGELEVETFNGGKRKRIPADYFPDNKGQLGKEFRDLGGVDKPVGSGDRKVSGAVIDFIQNRKKSEKPFFLTMGLSAPHYPLTVPNNLLQKYKGKIPPPEIPVGYLENLPLNYRHLRYDRKLENIPEETVKLARECYYAKVEWMDSVMGTVIETMRKSPLYENTIIIYMSDHGENMGEHGMWWKNTLYDTGSRVPLIISYPKKWKGGQIRSGAAGNVDLVQTIAEMAGAKTPNDWDGNSMLNWISQPNTKWKDLAITEYYGPYLSSGMSMIRMGEWKYVYHTRADERHPAEMELFNMKTDPKELHNLAKEPSQQNRLKEIHAVLVKQLGEDPEQSELRFRNGAVPDNPNPSK